jgi:hypothetical protein
MQQGAYPAKPNTLLNQSDGCGSCCQRPPLQNTVRDYNMLQGTYHPSDLSYMVLRDVNTKSITVENGSSTKNIGIAITTMSDGPLPTIQRILQPQETLHLGINQPEQAQQYLWLLDPQTKLPVGHASVLLHNANQFVLRDGVNKWFVSKYHQVGYRG